MGGLSRSDLGVWLINLPQSTARRNAMQERLAELDMAYEQFDAIDGRMHAAQLLRRVDTGAYARNMGKPILPGKMGLYASRVDVWQRFLDSPFKVALILEDDVVFHADFSGALDLALAAQGHWDIVRFNCIRAKMPIARGVIGQYRLNSYLGPFTGNACYLLQRDAAEKLLVNIWPQTRALDHEINRFYRHDIRLCGLEPWPSHVDDGGTSTITGAGFADVVKPRWYMRIPHYALKAGNYLRRFVWLCRHGSILPSSQELP